MYTLGTIVEKHPEFKDAIEYWNLAWATSHGSFQDEPILNAIEETRSIYEGHLCTIVKSADEIPMALLSNMSEFPEGKLQKLFEDTVERLQSVALKQLPNLSSRDLEAITVLPIQIYTRTCVAMLNASTQTPLDKVVLARGLLVAYEKLAAEVVTAVQLGLMMKV